MPTELTASEIRFDADTLRKYSTWFTIYGVVITLLGILAIAMPMIATLATSIFIGWLLVASAVFGHLRRLSGRQGCARLLVESDHGIALSRRRHHAARQSGDRRVVAHHRARGLSPCRRRRRRSCSASSTREKSRNAWLWILFSGSVDIVLGVPDHPGPAQHGVLGDRAPGRHQPADDGRRVRRHGAELQEDGVDQGGEGVTITAAAFRRRSSCPPAWADTAPSRRSRTRSNLLAAVSAARRSLCSHRRTGRRPSACARSPDGRNAGRSASIEVASIDLDRVGRPSRILAFRVAITSPPPP